ncbi:hypothetical protein AB4Y78_12240 [Janibacter sp. RAF52]|uniref:hypothetical protein n=1 Tax=unclassified Janibacter TaxID=2649294 RepID=UPI003F90F440
MTLLWGGLLLTRWRLGRTALTLSLGLTQAVVHALLSASEHPPVCASAGGGHHGMVTTCADGSMGHSPGAAMLLAHAVAALLLALVLARGEDAVWFVAGLLRPCLPTVTRLRVPSLRSPAPEPWGGLPRSVTVLGGVGRRGPPVRRALPWSPAHVTEGPS